MTPLIIAATAFYWAVAAFFSGEVQSKIPYEATTECPFEFKKFQQSIVWYAGKRLLLEANYACGSKFGHSYDLENVTVTIFSGKEVISRLHSSVGTYAFSRNEFVIGKANETDEHSCLGNPDIMSIHLRTGEVRSPGLRFFLNSDDDLPCKKG